MSKIAVVTDSTAYIQPEKMAGLPVFSIPLHIIWEGRDYLDGVDLSPEEYYPRLRNAQSLPKTSQVTPEEFVAFYRPLLEQGYQILSIHLSAGFSGTINSARTAAEQLGRSSFAILNSLSGTMPMAWQVAAAAKAALAGATLRECQAVAEKVRENSNIFFLPETLEFLHRGGRINWAQAFFGSVLQLIPIIEASHGVMKPVDKVRTMKRAIQRVMDLAQERVGAGARVHLAALHAGVPDLAAMVVEKARRQLGVERVVETLTTTISPVLGTHIGPGAVGLSYWVE